MRAADTNIVVRLLTGDDEAQFDRVRLLLTTDQLFISTTVMLETECVLRKAYRFEKMAIVGQLRRVAGLDNVSVQDPPTLARALDWSAEGMDFADALHLATSAGCTDMVSFDRSFSKRTAAMGTMPVVEP